MLWDEEAEALVLGIDDDDVSAVFTVMVLADASTETISALTVASFFLSFLSASSALASVFSWPRVRPDSDWIAGSLLLSLLVALGLCSAIAVPAAKTNPSSRVIFFMFPPVGCANGSLRPDVNTT
jgi:hypothetical protein